MNTEPFEIIAAPFTAYWAPAGEAFPDVDEDPAGNWLKIGAAGDQNYSEEGVVISHAQTIEKLRFLGGTGARKAVRTEEDFMVRLTLNDLTLEHYRLGLNNNAVNTTAAGSGTPGTKAINVYRGVQVATFALLVRGVFSPYGAGWNCQLQVPYCFQSASPEPTFVKGAAAGLALEFSALEDPNAASEDDRFGSIIAQHQTALP